MGIQLITFSRIPPRSLHEPDNRRIATRQHDVDDLLLQQDGAEDEPSEVRVMAISPVSVIRTECPVNMIVARTIDGQIVSTREPGVDCNVDWIIEFPAAQD